MTNAQMWWYRSGFAEQAAQEIVLFFFGVLLVCGILAWRDRG